MVWILVLIAFLILLGVLSQIEVLRLKGSVRYWPYGSKIEKHAGLTAPGYVDIETLPGYLVVALTFHEDDLFFEHSGFNTREILTRIKLFLAGKSKLAGGSSISQQLVKNIYFFKWAKRRSVLRKIFEFIFALQLERQFSKKEILGMYLQTLRLGCDIVGLENASRHYFNSTPQKLSILECFILFGTIPNALSGELHLLYQSTDRYFRYQNARNQFADIFRWYCISFGEDSLSDLSTPGVRQIIQKLSQHSKYDPFGLSGDLQHAIHCHAMLALYKLRLRIRQLPTRSFLRTNKLKYIAPAEEYILIGASTGVWRKEDLAVLKSCNPGQLIDLAERHALTIGLAEYLKLVELWELPEKYQAELEKRVERAAAETLKMSVEFGKLNRALKQEGITVIQLKGPCLQKRLYGNFNQRISRDLDLLVSSSELSAASKALHKLEFESLLPLESPKSRLIGYSERCLGFYNREKNLKVELHTDLAERAQHRAIDTAELFEKSQSVYIDELEQEFLVLDSESELLFLAVHGAKHMWCRYYWLKDLATLIGKYDFNWETVFSKADDWCCRRKLTLCLMMLERYFSVSFPVEVKREYQKARTLHGIAWNQLGSMFKPRAGWIAKWENLEFNLAVADNTVEYVRYILCRLLLPNTKDIRFINLPDFLFPLYFLVRPTRIAAESIRSQTENGRQKL